jgi:hypothetical protein
MGDGLWFQPHTLGLQGCVAPWVCPCDTFSCAALSCDTMVAVRVHVRIQVAGMHRAGIHWAGLLWIILTTAAFGQNAADEDFHIYTDSPRLLLTRQRLRLVQREHERMSMRWEQFDTLISGGVPMAEPGFAFALYYRASGNAAGSNGGGNAAAGRKAVDWALSDGARSDTASDLRQLALVFDWCGPLMNPAQTDRLGAKIERAIGGTGAPDVRSQSARVLAAIAIADRFPDQGAAILGEIVQKWWRGGIVPRLARGEAAVPREQIYALYEMMHALRDNLKIDLRESAEDFFKQLPMDQLTGQYPTPFPGPEGLFHIPVYAHDGEPDLTEAALARAAEMAMVAFDNNAADSQYLQGWLMQDRFQMQGGFGSPYEFLWADPYQPGLSYFQVPLIFHDGFTGHLFARLSWDEDAAWIGYFDGHLQLFNDGSIQTLKPGAAAKPVRVGDAVVVTAPAKDAAQFHLDSEVLFILSLEPRAVYDVEIDDQGLDEAETDAGGTLVVSVPEGIDAGLRLKLRRDLKAAR